VLEGWFASYGGIREDRKPTFDPTSVTTCNVSESIGLIDHGVSQALVDQLTRTDDDAEGGMGNRIATSNSERAHRPAQAATPDRRLGRLPSLDGVRAVAVVLTSLVHLLPNSVPGGFLGVDMFFVLSGFLITSILLGEHATSGRIALVPFYIRRARRLLPAVALVMVVFVAVTLLSNPSRHDIVVAGVVVVAVVTYCFNWSDAFGHHPPWQVDHLWSLSVEEQFYLVWPVVLILALGRVGRRTIILATIALAVASSVGQGLVYVHTRTVDLAYLASPLHAQGILLGCVLAQLYVWRLAEPAMAWIARARVLPIVAMIVLGVLSATLDLDHLTAYAGGMSLAAVAAAVLIASLIARETLGLRDRLTRTFSHPVVVAIGKRSYSIYLWQNFIAWALTSSLRGSWLWVPANVVCTLACAEVSYRFVERRFISKPRRSAAARTPIAARPGD
jgi:peptidoglycan/LPS O-acetylase OafA/YrhL